jgi:hypothetical protein
VNLDGVTRAPAPTARERLEAWFANLKLLANDPSGLYAGVLAETDPALEKSPQWVELAQRLREHDGASRLAVVLAEIHWGRLDDDEALEAIVEVGLAPARPRPGPAREEWVWLGVFREQTGVMKLVSGHLGGFVHCRFDGNPFGLSVQLDEATRSALVRSQETRACDESRGSYDVVDTRLRVSPSGTVESTSDGRLGVELDCAGNRRLCPRVP